MWECSLQGRGYGTVEFQLLFRYPIDCDSCRRRGMVNRRSVPAPNPPPCFSGEGRVFGQNPLCITPLRLQPQSPVLIQVRPDCPHPPSYLCLISPRFSSCGDSLVDKYTRLLRNPRVVARLLFVRLRYGMPQLREDLV